MLEGRHEGPARRLKEKKLKGAFMKIKVTKIEPMLESDTSYMSVTLHIQDITAPDFKPDATVKVAVNKDFKSLEEVRAQAVEEAKAFLSRFVSDR